MVTRSTSRDGRSCAGEDNTVFALPNGPSGTVGPPEEEEGNWIELIRVIFNGSDPKVTPKWVRDCAFSSIRLDQGRTICLTLPVSGPQSPTVPALANLACARALFRRGGQE